MLHLSDSACRHLHCEKIKEHSASTVAFISYRSKLTKVLVGAAWGERREVRVWEAK